MDAVKRYDIDGVHFDDYFYPYPVAGQVFDDAATYAQYGARLPDTWQDWRRNNIDLLIQELQRADPRGQAVGEVRHLAVRRLAEQGDRPGGLRHHRRRPDVRRPRRRHPQVGPRGVDRLHRPAGLLGRSGSRRPTTTRSCRGGRSRSAARDVHLYIGEATYKVGTSTQSPDWPDPDELSDHLAFDSTIPEVKGNIYFSAKDVRADRLGTWTSSRPTTTPTRP